MLLHHYMGEIDGEYRAWGLPVGGTGAISGAIAAAAREAGAELRTDARRCARIRVDDGRATGVVLESGEEIARRARAVERRRATHAGSACSSPARLPADG